MDTSLHLVSMPMHDPLQPSAQLGYLHGHVHRNFGDRIALHSYSAHTQILYMLEGAGMAEFFNEHRLFGEEMFFLACCHAFPRLFERAYAHYRDFRLVSKHLDREQIARLCEIMRAYLDAELLPALQPGRLHVIGFTTTFAQVFASIFAAQHLRQRTHAELLFVFGGASMALPEAARVLRLWEVPGLIVTGAGERPLEQIVEACLELDELDAGQVLAQRGAREFVNVSRIGVGRKPIDLKLTRAELDAIGDPDYDEFFTRLARLCSNERVYQQLLGLVAIPLEGSRGCFAKCDFCQNPNITTQFRSLGGEQVAARARRLVARHGTPRLYFADSVCNSWAEAYAEDLLRTDERFAAFMEMRVHATQSFFTVLALAGVSEMQLGIEAVSGPLLSAMQKGTTVLQNLRAAKYLAELGIESGSNLITHHPKSSLQDVSETRRIVELVDHLPPFCLSKFVISYASPVYNQLSEQQQQQLVRGFTWLPEDLRDYSMVRDLAYPYPSEWLDPVVERAWDDFRRWHATRVGGAELSVVRGEDGLRVVDTRSGRRIEHVLSGDLALVCDAGHAGPTLARLCVDTGLSPERCAAAIEQLADSRLVIELDGRVLSLPLRPRQELIDDFCRRPGARLRHAAKLAVLEGNV